MLLQNTSRMARPLVTVMSTLGAGAVADSMLRAPRAE
jgi:hypothetical protein